MTILLAFFAGLAGGGLVLVGFIVFVAIRMRDTRNFNSRLLEHYDTAEHRLQLSLEEHKRIAEALTQIADKVCRP